MLDSFLSLVGISIILKDPLAAVQQKAADQSEAAPVKKACPFENPMQQRKGRSARNHNQRQAAIQFFEGWLPVKKVTERYPVPAPADPLAHAEGGDEGEEGEGGKGMQHTVRMYPIVTFNSG